MSLQWNELTMEQVCNGMSLQWSEFDWDELMNEFTWDKLTLEQVNPIPHTSLTLTKQNLASFQLTTIDFSFWLQM